MFYNFNTYIHTYMHTYIHTQKGNSHEKVPLLSVPQPRPKQESSGQNPNGQGEVFAFD